MKSQVRETTLNAEAPRAESDAWPLAWTMPDALVSVLTGLMVGLESVLAGGQQRERNGAGGGMAILIIPIGFLLGWFIRPPNEPLWQRRP